MSLTVIIKEFFRLLREKILLVVLFVALFGGMAFFLGSKQMKEGGTEKVVEEEVAYKEVLANVYAQQPAVFEVSIMYDGGTYFSNAALLDAYFSSPDMVKTAQAKTGIPLDKWYEAEMFFYDPSLRDERGGIFVNRNRASEVQKFYVNNGASAEENLKLANYYFDQIMGGDVPILTNTLRYVITSPHLIDHERDATGQLINVPDQVKVKRVGTSPKTLAMAGAILGLIGIFLLLFFFYLLKDTIRYAFQYAWTMDDVFLMFNRKKEKDRTRLKDFFAHNRGQVILAQNAIEGLDSLPDILSYSGEKAAIQCLAILIEEGKTSRSWYSHQHDLIKPYHVPVYVLHVRN